MSQKDDEAGKLFVGGLSWETSQDSLSRFFGQFGEVVDCVVMKNNETGRSRGFGFVTFKDPRCVDDVLASGPHNLDGRTIDPKICNPRSMQKASGDHSKVRLSDVVQKSKTSNSCPKIFLGGLPANITETDLGNYFAKYGKVSEVVIMYDQEKKRSRGFGFLSFEKEESVEQVCGEHFVTINGKQVECKRAKPPDGRPGMRSQGNHWNGAGMGMGPGAMPPPHMGGPMGAPAMGPPHMGPMPNGMPSGMMGGAYQSGGWGPQPGGTYGQGYGAPPPSPGYQGWGHNYSSYGPQYGSPAAQGGYGYGTPGPGSYPGYTWGSPTPGAASSTSAGSNSDRGMYSQPAPTTPSNASSAGGAQPVSNSSPPETTNSTATTTTQGTSKTDYASYSGTLNNYPQEASAYGPMRTYEAAAAVAADTTQSANSQGGSYSQSSTLSQRYHPFRRQ